MISTWPQVKTRHPKFVALLEILQQSNYWHELCPEPNYWEFQSNDGRFLARVYWCDYVVKIWRRRIDPIKTARSVMMEAPNA